MTIIDIVTEKDKAKIKLYCPICREEDTNHNVMNGKPICIQHMMLLVTWSDLKKYNRKWRRNIKVPKGNGGFRGKNIRFVTDKKD
jgi:ribosomal protein L44E